MSFCYSTQRFEIRLRAEAKPFVPAAENFKAFSLLCVCVRKCVPSV